MAATGIESIVLNIFLAETSFYDIFTSEKANYAEVIEKKLILKVCKFFRENFFACQGHVHQAFCAPSIYCTK